MSTKPKNLNSASERELDKAQEQFKEFDASVKEMTMDRMAAAPKEEVEPKHKMSQNEIANSNDIYIKPKSTISCKEKFNEKYREEYNFQKEYVQFIAQNNELIGENIEIWTKKFAGQPVEFWEVPTNKPVWGPRYLAEQIKNCTYHRLKMTEQPTQTTGVGVMYGKMAVDTTIQRLDAQPVTKKKSVFMSDKTF